MDVFYTNFTPTLWLSVRKKDEDHEKMISIASSCGRMLTYMEIRDQARSQGRIDVYIVYASSEGVSRAFNSFDQFKGEMQVSVIMTRFAHAESPSSISISREDVPSPALPAEPFHHPFMGGDQSTSSPRRREVSPALSSRSISSDDDDVESVGHGGVEEEDDNEREELPTALDGGGQRSGPPPPPPPLPPRSLPFPPRRRRRPLSPPMYGRDMMPTYVRRAPRQTYWQRGEWNARRGRGGRGRRGRGRGRGNWM